MATDNLNNQSDLEKPKKPAKRRRAKLYVPTEVAAFVDGEMREIPRLPRYARVYEFTSKYDDLQCGICGETMPKGTPILWSPTCLSTHPSCGLPVYTDKTLKHLVARRIGDCRCGLRIHIGDECVYNVVTHDIKHLDCYTTHLTRHRQSAKEYYRELESYVVRTNRQPEYPPEIFQQGEFPLPVISQGDDDE